MYEKGFWVLILILLSISLKPVLAQESKPAFISIADTNANGGLGFHDYEGWQFSFETPSEINDQRNLVNTQAVDLRNFKELKEDPRWNNYGWFELELYVDSTIAGIPWVFSHRGHEPVKVWLNGVEILKNGNPSPTVGDETLSRFVNEVQTGIILREGANNLLVEYSEHNAPKYFNLWQWSNDSIHLILNKQYEPFQRRHRAFVFGGAGMVLAILVLIHLFLTYKFREDYHIWIVLTTLFMLIHLFTAMSDTMIDWSYSYLPFYEYSDSVSFIIAMYFFLIAIRNIYGLSVPWRTLSSFLGVFTAIALISTHINISWIHISNSILVFLILGYGIYSLVEAKHSSADIKIWIIATGLAVTMGGVALYVILYLTLGIHSNKLFLTAIFLAYTGIPVALTFNVAVSYALLIDTLETKVKLRTADLETANEYQNRFFANVSHEFRTPLTIGEGMVNKLIRLKEFDPSQVRQDLSVVKRNMSRIKDMVNQIIDLTKSDQDYLKINQNYYSAGKLTSLSVESFRSLAESHGHSFEFMDETEDAVLFVDRSKVEIMINNLISNAIKFTPNGGSIIIKSKVEEGQFVLTVSDDGPGIPNGDEEAIFERFHRIERPELEYVEGMGVGLELSRTLARLHGGDIIAKPGQPKGAVFVLTLPVAEIDDTTQVIQLEDFESDYELPAEQIVDTHNLSLLEKTTLKILLVEDNADMRSYVEGILSNLGEVATAADGVEGLAMIRRNTPDLIITDLMMPNMDGKTFVQKLAAHDRWKEIPVIVLTAKALEQNKTDLLRIGVVDYITKPFEPEQLLLKSRNLLTYYKRRLNAAAEPSEDEDETLTQQLISYIKEQISDPKLTVDIMVERFPQSRRSLYRNIQKETGMTPSELIREVRLTTARDLVNRKEKSYQLEELAHAVGYKSASSFRKVYENRFGMHPLR